jgi:cyclic pyranopterin phosphate synthase
MCLGQDHSYGLRPLLRQGISDASLKAALIEAITLKPRRHEFREKPGHIMRFMSMTGG